MSKEIISEFESSQLVYNHIKYADLTRNVIGPQTHDVFEILYLKNGDLTYQVEGKKYRVQKNAMIVTRPCFSHVLTLNSTKIYERYDFLFENKVVSESVLKKLPDEMNLINLNDCPEIADIFSRMDRYCANFEGEELSKILSNLVEEIFYNVIIISDKFPKNQLSGSYSANPVISRAIDYIDTHLSEPFGIKELCSELFVSRSYLHQLFMHHMQTSPQKYISTKRLLAAQKELRSFKKPTEVYSLCGFADYSSFYRAYKKHFGYSPSEELDRESLRVIDF